MLRSITWKQFQEWQAFDDISPIGDRRGDWQAASIASGIMNVICAMHGSTRRFKINDVILDFDPPEETKEDRLKGWADTKGGAKVETPARDYRVMKHYARMYVAMSRAEKPKPTRTPRPPKPPRPPVVRKHRK